MRWHCHLKTDNIWLLFYAKISDWNSYSTPRGKLICTTFTRSVSWLEFTQKQHWDKDLGVSSLFERQQAHVRKSGNINKKCVNEVWASRSQPWWGPFKEPGIAHLRTALHRDRSLGHLIFDFSTCWLRFVPENIQFAPFFLPSSFLFFLSFHWCIHLYTLDLYMNWLDSSDNTKVMPSYTLIEYIYVDE